MERWGRVIDVAFGLFFYPLSGDIFSRKQTAVFRNTEGDIIGNLAKKTLKNLNATSSPVPLCPSIRILLPALLDSVLNQIGASGMPLTVN